MKKNNYLVLLFLSSFLLFSCDRDNIKETSSRKVKKDKYWSKLNNDTIMVSLFNKFNIEDANIVETRGNSKAISYNLNTSVILDLGNGNKLIFAETSEKILKHDLFCFYYSESTNKIIFKLNNNSINKEEQNIITRSMASCRDKCYKDALDRIERATRENALVDIGVTVLKTGKVFEVLAKMAIYRGCGYECRSEIQ